MTLFEHAEPGPHDREKIREGYEAARTNVALADLSHIGKLLFKGPDRHKFLHGILTNDVLNLKPGQGFPTCLLTPKGKLVADFVLYNRGQDLLAIAQPKATAAIQSTLSKYLSLSHTVMEDVSACFHAFHLVGPKLFALLEDLGDIRWRWPLPSYACQEVSWRDTALFFLSYPSIAPEGVLVLCPPSLSQELWTCFLHAGQTYRLRNVTSQTLEVLRVESGKPLFGVDMDGENLPLEVNLEETISFSKGCYLGQETTARVKNRGHVNRRLVGLKISGSDLPAAASLSRGSPIFLEGQAVGTITSVVESPRLKSLLALALIRQPQDLPGTRLEVSLGDRRQVAEVVAFPLPV